MRLPLAVIFCIAACVSIQASALPFFDQLKALRNQKTEAPAHNIAPLQSVGLGKIVAEGDTVSGVFGMGTGTVAAVFNSPLSNSSEVKLFDEFGYEHGSLYSDVQPSTVIFRGVYPGRYTLGVGHEEGWLGNTWNTSDITWFDVAAGESVVVDTLTIPARTGTPVDSISISGHVYVGSGTATPFVGDGYIQWSRMNDSWNSADQLISCDAAGFFTVRLPRDTGTWYLLLSGLMNSNATYLTVWLGNEELFATPAPFSLTADINNVAVHLGEGGTLKGRLIDPDSTFICEYTYLYLIERNTGAILGNTSVPDYHSGQNGDFLFEAVPPGDYILQAEGSGSSDIYAKSWFWPGLSDPLAATSISIGAGTSDSIAFTLKRNPALTGATSGSSTVTGTVIAPGRVGMAPLVLIHTNGSSVSGGGSSSAAPVMTYAKSNSYIDQPITISATMDDIYLRETWYRSGSSTTSEDSATILTLAEGETKSGLDITMPEGGSLAGFLVDENAAPLSIYGDMGMVLVASNPAQVGAANAPYGSPVHNGIRIPGLAPGNYGLSLAPFNFAGAESALPQFSMASAIASSDSVHISLDSTSVPIITASAVSGMIRGTFTTDAAFIRNNPEYIMYAVRPDGSVASMVLVSNYYPNSGSVTPLMLFTEFASGLIAGPGPQTQHLAVGALPAGDYTIAIGYETADGVMLRWYGQSTATPIADFPWDYHLTVPAEAISINLPTNASLVDNINFGSATPINSSLLSKAALNLSARSTGSGLHVSWSGLPGTTKDAMLSLFSLTGQVLFSQSLSSSKGSLAVDRPLAAGLYVLKLSAGDLNRTLKVIR